MHIYANILESIQLRYTVVKIKQFTWFECFLVFSFLFPLPFLVFHFLASSPSHQFLAAVETLPVSVVEIRQPKVKENHLDVHESETKFHLSLVKRTWPSSRKDERT